MLSVNQKKCDLCGKCVQVCPFGAMEIRDSRVEIGAACRMCRICLKNCPNHAILFTDGVRKKADRDRWKGILVFVECEGKQIHPVTLELIGIIRFSASSSAMISGKRPGSCRNTEWIRYLFMTMSGLRTTGKICMPMPWKTASNSPGLPLC